MSGRVTDRISDIIVPLMRDISINFELLTDTLKYGSIGQGYIFMSFGIETMGLWGPETHKLF